MEKLDLNIEKSLFDKAKSDKSEFQAIYKYLVKDVYRFSYSLTKNAHDAEDITSQTFTIFFEKFDSFNWTGVSMKFWLFKTAKNLCFKKFNLKENNQFEENTNDDIDKEISFVDEIMNQDLLDKLQEEILKLSPSEINVINLRIWEGMSFVEIAEINNSTKDKERMRFNRAIEKLRKKVQERELRALIPLPFLFTGIKQVGSSSLFSIPTKLLSGSFISSLFTKTTMSATLITIKTFLATTAGKITAGVLATLVVTGTVTGAYYATQNQKQDNTQTAENSVTPTPTTETTPTEIVTPTPEPQVLSFVMPEIGLQVQYKETIQVVRTEETKNFPVYTFTNANGSKLTFKTINAGSGIFKTVNTLPSSAKPIKFPLDGDFQWIKYESNGKTDYHEVYITGDMTSYDDSNEFLTLDSTINYRLLIQSDTISNDDFDSIVNSMSFDQKYLTYDVSLTETGPGSGSTFRWVINTTNTLKIIEQNINNSFTHLPPPIIAADKSYAYFVDNDNMNQLKKVDNKGKESITFTLPAGYTRITGITQNGNEIVISAISGMASSPLASLSECGSIKEAFFVIDTSGKLSKTINQRTLNDGLFTSIRAANNNYFVIEKRYMCNQGMNIYYPVNIVNRSNNNILKSYIGRAVYGDQNESIIMTYPNGICSGLCDVSILKLDLSNLKENIVKSGQGGVTYLGRYDTDINFYIFTKNGTDSSGNPTFDKQNVTVKI